MGWENWDFPKGWVRVTYLWGSGLDVTTYPVCTVYLTWPLHWPPRARR